MGTVEARIAALELAIKSTLLGELPAQIVERARQYAEFALNGSHQATVADTADKQ